ncbi:TetR/AcrR family transcriptional regulator [Peterkaempfera bronchialis]|uniref:TetR/AcrR family transcriptional regulator n=1 Tax=Peterkaempfera bronchialis TaxID=2126346 RepID=A0A345SSP5_9ACTN|nr:TetR/AcrR family transcriptional regulator [Peterkaempfera bronchialis]
MGRRRSRVVRTVLPGPLASRVADLGTGTAAEPDTALPVQARLLAVASALFAERGFAQTSVQDIVEHAGVTKGAMYHYYSSKDDLLQEIYTRLLVLQSERLAEIAARPLPAAERLRAAAADVVVTTLDHLDDAVVSMRSMHMLPEKRQATVRADRRRYHERFRALVEEGQRTGELRSDVSADLVVHQFFGGIHHLGTWYRPEGELRPEEIGATFADLLLRGLTDR